jgi:hypothetical protein
MMTQLGKMHIRKLAAFVCETLRKEGLEVTLSGGACAEIYSNRKYVTGDLDFVTTYIGPENGKIIERVMKKLGFVHTGRIYINPEVHYSIEFPPGPLGIGNEDRIRPVKMEFKTGTLSLLSATDCAKDRLVGYFHGNDLQCLEQAVMICSMNEVDMANIQKWSKSEGQQEKYKRLCQDFRE